MDKKMVEAQHEFKGLLDYVLRGALGREIHEVEDGIYRRLFRLGRILLELFVLAAGKGKTGEKLINEDGTVFRYVRDSGREYLSIFGEITIVRAHYAKEG